MQLALPQIQKFHSVKVLLEPIPALRNNGVMIMRRDRNISSIRFRKTGIFVYYRDGEEEGIGDPIRVLALGQGLQDGLSYIVLELLDRDMRWRKAVVRSSLLTARTTEFRSPKTIARLTLVTISTSLSPRAMSA